MKKTGKRRQAMGSIYGPRLCKKGGYNYVNCRRISWDKKKLDFLDYNKYLLDCWEAMSKAMRVCIP